jgi:hypothetical protein
VRRRAAERGPLFDRMPGLAFKLFLVDPVDPCYATFYLWREPEAALAFLEGAFFAALSRRSGGPRSACCCRPGSSSRGRRRVTRCLATTQRRRRRCGASTRGPAPG